MTFDQGIQTNWGTAMDDFVNKVESLTNFTQVSEDWDSDELKNGDSNSKEHFKVFEHSGTTEYIQFSVDSSREGFKIQYGQDYDTVNDTWDDRYPNDPTYDYRDIDDYGLAPSDSGFNVSITDTVTYDIYDDGADNVHIFVERQENDGDDAHMFLGLHKLNKLWDYSTADNKESEYVIGLDGYAKGERHTQMNHLSNGGAFDRQSEKTYTLYGIGRPNPDSNFSDYPAVPENVVVSNLYNQTPVGKHANWFIDLAGSHGDTISDSDTGSEYLIRKPFDDDEGIAIKTN